MTGVTIVGITALLSQFAMLCNPTPAVEVLTLYQDMVTEGQQYLYDKNAYLNNSDVCRWEYPEQSRLMISGKKMFCFDIVEHLQEKRIEIGNKAMKFSGLCQQFFTTSNPEECVEKAYEELTQLIEQ